MHNLLFAAAFENVYGILKFSSKVYLKLFGEEEEWYGNENQRGSTYQKTAPPHADPMPITGIWKKR